MAAAFVVVVAGFTVGPRQHDPHASFRCPPPVVSAWSNAVALEKEKLPPGTPDADVNVGCAKPAQGRVAVASSLGLVGVIFLTVSAVGHPDERRRPVRRIAAR